MTTILVDGNYVVSAGQNLTFTAASNVAVYTLDGQSSSGDPSFTDNGSIQVSSIQDGATVIAFSTNSGSFFTNSLIKVAQGSTFAVNATGAASTAYGFSNGDSSPSFENDGLFSVSAVATAVGIVPWAANRFVNTGTFLVSAANATGVGANDPGSYSNSGHIEVDGATRAAAFSLTDITYAITVSNQGTITATATSGASYGVVLAGLTGSTATTITNSGTITAHHAIYEVADLSGTQSPSLHITNSGTINGEVTLGPGRAANDPYPRPTYDSEIFNTGAINGAVYLSLNGNDLYDGRGGTQSGGIFLGAGIDTVHLGADGETVYGGSGAAHVTGGTGADTFVGGAGNDVVDGGGGNNVLNGGGGSNTASFASATTGVTVSLALQGSTQATGVDSTTLSNFQNILGSAHDDVLTGDANNNVIDGGGGNDVIDGGGGSNAISFASAASGVTISLALQGASQAVGTGSVAFTNIQNLIGSAFSDHLTGDANDNVIDGGSGGADVLDGGGGTNTVSFALATSGVTISLVQQGSSQPVGTGSVTFTNFQILTGSAFNDTLEGDGNNNVLDGGGGTNTVSYVHAASGVSVSLALQGQAQNTVGAGTDTLSNFQNLTGSAFNDTLEGDGNNNVLDGGGGINTVSYAHATSGVTVSLVWLGQPQDTGGAGTDTLSNFQNLIGSAYSDTLTSSTGTSSLTGGGGADTFKINSAASVTTITDFSRGQGDKIDLTALTQFSSIADVQAAATQVGANTVIHTGSGSLTLDNVTALALTASDFKFVGGPILAFPYGSVCYITDVIDGQAYSGSGVIVGPHTILTAAHMVWDQDSGQSATNIEIYPGYSPNQGYGPSYQTSIPGVAIHYNPVDDANGEISKSDSQSDFAVIDVAQNLDTYGWFQIDPNYAGGPGNISGYPGANGFIQQDTTGLLTADPSYHVIDYSASFDVSPGSSGGPVWINQGTSSAPSPAVVGVVSTADWGAQITSADLAQIEGWVAQDTGLFSDAAGDITGSIFNDHLIGDPGNDIIDGQGGDDVLTGGGGNDTFLMDAGVGHVVITDFDTAHDIIDVSAYFSNFASVGAAVSQHGANTVIQLGSGGTLTLDNVTMSSLVASDFGFTAIAPPGGGAVTGTAANHYTVSFEGAYGQYTVGVGGATVSGGPEGGTDDLANIQRIQFVDGYLATSPTDTAGEVYRLYEATLNRAPDQEGLTNWVNSLNSGSSLQSVVNGFVNSTEFQQVYGALDNTGFVTLLYHNVLHRDPDSGGLANWVGMLASGQDTRAQVVLGFSESPEDIAALAAPVQQGLWIANPDAAEVARLYDTVLGRLPDASGLANWTHSLEGGTSLQSVANGFVGSQEFQSVYGALNNTDFVTLLYHNVLHRDPDTGGLANWVGMLSSGQETRAQVVVGFSESPEHITNTAAHVDGGIWLAS